MVYAAYKLMCLFPRSVMLKAVLTGRAAAVAAKNGLGGRVLGSNQVVFSASSPVNITKVNHRISKYLHQ